MELIFVLLIGLVIGGVAGYFLSQKKLQPLQRKLDSSEKKLERANRALEDAESLRSQQTLQAQELQNARQQIQSLEASYQGQLRNLEQSYELQFQELEKAQGNPAALADSQDRIRKIEQSYQAQIQELQANHHNEKSAIEQSYQAQIRELQQSHQQTLEDIQQRQTAPIQTFETSSETPQGSGWPGAAMGAAAIAGVAGLAGWATSSFLNREEEAETPVIEETPEETLAESPVEISDETPELTLEENWADQPLAEEVAVESEFMGWTEPVPVVEEISEDLVAESPFEISDETPELTLEENWVDVPLGEDILGETDLASWTEPETAQLLDEFELPDAPWDLGESFDTPVEVEIPTPENLQDLPDISENSELDFLSRLQTEESPLSEAEAFSSFLETPDLGLPDFLGEETLNDDLQLLDMFPPENDDLANIPETFAGEVNTPFINFFDSEAEKSDLEFLEMLKTEDEVVNSSVSEESDDLFGDLFSPDESPSPGINDLFNLVESETPKAGQDGLEDLFSDDVLSFDDWDLSSSEKPSSD